MSLENNLSEDNKLENLFKREWLHDLENSPESATFLGVNTYNDRLNSYSEESIQKHYEHQKEVMKELESFDITKLSEVNNLNLDLFKLRLEHGIKSVEFKEHFEPINQMHGLHNYFHRLLSIMTLKNDKDAETMITRIKALPRVVDEIITLMKNGIKNGITVPQIAMQDVPNQIGRQLPAEFEKSAFYSLLNNKNLSESTKEKLTLAMKEELYGAFTLLKDFIEKEYIPACRTTIGLSEIPNGRALYDLKLRDFTTTNLTATEIHEIGLKEVARIFSEIQDLMKKEKFETYEAFLEHLRTAPEFYFTSETELLMTYRDFAKRVDKELPRFFKVLPRLPYGIEKIPDHQAPSCPTAYYMSPDLGMTRAGIFYANTYQLETRPKYELEALALHEAVPGHHLQIALALELQNLPEFRKVARFTGYVEGWGLYSEKLGAEMGFYDSPYTKFGQLSFEIWRACRLVVDTGIHAFGWTREKAIEYLQYYTGKSTPACTVEVDRYIVMPAQATAYKVGELKILELRSEFEQTQGENFSIKDFHHLVLENGAIPLSVLEKVREYLSSYGK